MKASFSKKRHISSILRTSSGGWLPRSMLAFRVAGNAWALSALAASPVIRVLWRLVLFLNMLNQPLPAVKVSGVSPFPTCICTKMHLAFYIIMSWHGPSRLIIYPNTKPSSHFFTPTAS